MKKTGVIFMFVSLLMGFYLTFGVYLPQVVPAQDKPSVVIAQSPPSSSGGSRSAAKQSPEIYLAKRDMHKPVQKPKQLFNTPDGLADKVKFWTDIYSKYTIDEAVLHNPYDLSVVYGVVPIPHCNEPPTKECINSREDAIQSAKKELCVKADSVAECSANIRAQTGQKDKFLEAIPKAENIIGDVEEIFDNFGVPKEISRLPFVESMFNENARSHAGAAGIWQFMPRTAKLFGLKVTKGLDERLDIEKATIAAAKHILRDYKRLGKWELAINAYNTGPGRMANAVRTLGTDNIVKIIKDYYHPAYGFASRNFYPEFLAALHVYENRHSLFPELYHISKKENLNEAN